MAIEFKYLKWDSKILDINCAMIELDQEYMPADSLLIANDIISKCGSNEFDFLTIKLPGENKEVRDKLIDYGAKLIDNESVLEYHTLNECRRNSAPDVKCVFYQKVDAEPFLPLAREMTCSRFFRDDKIPAPAAIRLWEESIKNHCSGLADELVIGYFDNKPAGIITVNINDSSIDLRIVGVLKEYRRRGVGRAMLGIIAERYSGKKKIYVQTQQDNAAAQSLYKSAGFRPRYSRFIMHYWKE